MKAIHVAVGVILNKNNQVLIAKRPDNFHQGGLWEFPGGKVEVGETVKAALIRELSEEVDIQLASLQPLLEINHDYGDKRVLLDVWLSRDYSGEAQGLEGQEIRWVGLASLKKFDFPAANQAIIESLLALEAKV